MSPLSDPPASPPPVSPRFERDEDGLVKGLTYHYTPEGRIDWRAMVDKRHLYVVKEKEARVVAAQGKPIDECDLSLVNEKWLRIKLDGINQIANIRGYTALTYPSFVVSDAKAAVVCEMTFLPSYETSGYPVVCSGIGSACRLSMDKGFLGYLEAFAENRAFARCVKRALQIAILSDIEVGGDGKEEAPDDDVPIGENGVTGFKPCHDLADLCLKRAKPITFEAVRKAAATYSLELKTDPATWTDWESIPPLDAYVITTKLMEKDASAAVAKGGKK